MNYNQFDIATAYYLYFSHYHGGQWCGYYARLSAMTQYFRPSPLLHDENDLNENAREIYDNLVANPPRDSLQPIHERYEVTVGNIGMVYSGMNFDVADKTFDEYVELSKSNYGRAAGEQVALWENGEPLFEHEGTFSDEDPDY